MYRSGGTGMVGRSGWRGGHHDARTRSPRFAAANHGSGLSSLWRRRWSS